MAATHSDKIGYDPFPFDFELAYRADGWGEGIAWRVDRYQSTPDHDTHWSGYEQPTGMVVAHLIGDDRPFEFDPNELTPIADEDFCGCCGQIGCAWG